MICVIVLLCCLFVIGCALSLYFNWRAGKDADRAIEYIHKAKDALNIAKDATDIAIKALHSDMDELEILEQRLEKLKQKKQ